MAVCPAIVPRLMVGCDGMIQGSCYRDASLAREGRFHGWQTAESTRPAASEGSRRTARSHGRREQRCRGGSGRRGGNRTQAQEKGEGSREAQGKIHPLFQA